MQATSPTESERPLPSGRNALYLLVGASLVGLFYVYVVLALSIGVMLWPLLFVLTLADPQFRGRAFAAPLFVGLGSAMTTLTRTLRMSSGPQYSLKLRREQAPRLWEVVEDLSRRLKVAPPDEFYLYDECGAYVKLDGIVAGRGKTQLGVGFDLLAGLTEVQSRAVMAHEIAHAKYVKRGAGKILNYGLMRIEVCVNDLSGMRDARENSKAMRSLMRWTGALPEKIGATVGKLNAACSRYEEFRADRIAAEICGPAVCREALLAVHVIAELSEELEPYERLTQLERETSYSQWLRQKLEVADGDRRTELETRQLERAPRYEVSSHPALPDRLAAIREVKVLEEVAQVESASVELEGPQSGLVWLANADEIAAQLMRHIEETVAQQEAKNTRWALKRRLKIGRLIRTRYDRYFLLAFLIAVVFFCKTVIAMGPNGLPNIVVPRWFFYAILAEIVVISPIVFVLQKGSASAKIAALSIPPLAIIESLRVRRLARRRAASEDEVATAKLSPVQRGERDAKADAVRARANIERAAALRASVPTALRKPKHIARFHIVKGYEALATGDIATAASRARLALEIEPQREEAILLRAICCASEGQSIALEEVLAISMVQSEARHAWARALLAYLAGNYSWGERILLVQLRHHPKNPMIRALLSFCQLNNNRKHEALSNIRSALELRPQTCELNPAMRRADEACYRLVLTKNLMSCGQLKAARSELDWLADHRARLDEQGEPLVGFEPFELDRQELKWQVASGQTERALVLAERMVAQHTATHQQITVSEILQDSREEALLAVAHCCYERLLQGGFYPDALFGLARIALSRGHKTEARALSLQALNTRIELPWDALEATEVLDWVCYDLHVIDDAAPALVTGWAVALDAKGLNLKDEKLTLLCLAASEREGRVLAEEIFTALVPGEPLEKRIEVYKASHLFQPDVPHSPGISRLIWGTDSHF